MGLGSGRARFDTEETLETSEEMKIAYDLREVLFQKRGWHRVGINLLIEIVNNPQLEFVFIVEDESVAISQFEFLNHCKAEFVVSDLDRSLDSVKQHHPAIDACDIFHSLTEFPEYLSEQAKTIVTVHDTSFRICSELTNPDFVNAAEKALNWSITSSDGILVFSDWVATCVEAYRAEHQLTHKGPITKIYGGADHLARIDPSDVSSLPLTQPYLLYVGGTEPDKNLSLLLDVFESEQQLFGYYNLVLAGPDICQLHHPLALSGHQNLYISPSASDSELATLYSNADYFITPSLDEGFGLCPLEALYFDTPSLCSEIPAFKESMGHSAIYFSPHSHEDLTNKISMTINNPDLHNQLLSEKSKIMSRYSWRQCAADMLEFYKSVI